MRRLSRQLSTASVETTKVEHVTTKFVDGGIIGGPPSQKAGQWKVPSIPVSGPEQIPNELFETLNMKRVSDRVGSASALKACFASINKGFTLLSMVSYTTAHTAGVLPELQEHLAQFAPALKTKAESGMTDVAPKAYRWVDEMRQIGETFDLEGGFGNGLGGRAMFDGIADLCKFVADDTVLGHEKVGKRKRGTTVEDVAEAMKEGIAAKKKKKEQGDEKLEMTWRGSWS